MPIILNEKLYNEVKQEADEIYFFIYYDNFQYE